MNDIPDPVDLFDEPREKPECAGCRGCGLPIFWVVHKNGKKAPYDFNGQNHFGTCVNAKDFKR